MQPCMSFRETLWFKKGDLDVRAADEAAAAPEEQRADKADTLPIEDRYDDDGSVTRADSAVYGIHTGSTQWLKQVAKPTGDLEAHVLIREMKRQRRVYLALLAGAVAVGGALMLLL